MSEFKTKIVQKTINGIEFHELLLPDGRCVASGSLEHCWNEREEWEEVLRCKAPAYNNDTVADQDVANLCLACEHRGEIRWLLKMPFCYYSSTTCSRRYDKDRCEDFKRRELTLFG